MPNSGLDADQCIQGAYDQTAQAFQVELVGGGGGASNVLVQNAPVTVAYDSTAITYVVSGNGAGQIATVSYYVGGLSGTLVATLTLSYNSLNQLISVVRT